jgi:hypothetical protein
MESTVRSPQAGDMVIVLAKMKSGRFTELSGCIEQVSTDYVYFGLDSINLCETLADDDGTPVERKIWPKDATKLPRVGVPLDGLKPFDGVSIDEDSPCWEVRV